MIIRKTLYLGNKDYYKTHLHLINAILPVQMTKKEIEILASFMSLKGSIEKDRFGTTARKFIKNDLHLSTAGLSNHIKSLKNKGFIREDNTVLSILFPTGDTQAYQFKFIKKEE